MKSIIRCMTGLEQALDAHKNDKTMT